MIEQRVFCGNAVDLMARADGVRAMITDPIWPNHGRVFDCDSASAVLLGVVESLPLSVERLVVVLGCDSDPRFLFESIPSRWPFLKSCFLEFVLPTRKGRNLYTNLVAYVFGEWPRSRVGGRVIPTKCLSRETEKRIAWHPTPMRVSHCSWLVRWFGEGGFVDPFAGSGSFGVAAVRHRVRYVGFEINEEYARLASERIKMEPRPWC